MSIVKMKHLRVIGLSAQRDALLQQLLGLGCVEISEPDVHIADPEWSALLRRDSSTLADRKAELAALTAALATLDKYASAKKGLFQVRQGISVRDFFDAGAKADALRCAEEINTRMQEIDRIYAAQNRITTQLAGLMPWESLALALEQTHTAAAELILCTFPAADDESNLIAELSQATPAAVLSSVSVDKELRYCLLIVHRSEQDAALAALRNHSFSPVRFTEYTGTAQENITRLRDELKTLEQQRTEQEQLIAAFAPQRTALQQKSDLVAQEIHRETVAERFLTDGQIFFAEGWAPAENLTEVEALLAETGCAWESADPTEEQYPEVPVQLKNNALTTPLNMVTEMYSLPAYNNIDPNPLMAPFFILFYGIMMADMGYGLLMIIAGILITRKFRPQGMMGYMFNLATLCGISTFIMGALTGGFFGDFLTQIVALTTGADFSLPSLFTPLNDTLMILIGSICLGFVHICVGMCIGVYIKIRRKQYLSALFEEVTWWIVFIGIAVMILFGSSIVLIVGCAMIVAGPLITGKGMGKLTGIFASLYNNITGYFGDLLSYSRLMALMLAGSVIAQVFNTLGAIPGNIVIFLVISFAGNMLNLALNLLGCYVHDLRLQCLEFFGRFYEDGGKPFRPLAVKTKYVDII